MTAAVATFGLTKDYGSLRAVDQLDLEVPSGSIFGFLGPNGAGKTTTIRMLLGLIGPTAGRIELLGRPHRGPGDPVLASVGALVEQPGFWRHLTGRRNLEIWSRSGPEPETSRLARIDSALEKVGLLADGHRKVKTYSHGMKQRLGVAQALLNDPALLVLDEPTDGLDPEGIRDMRDLMRRLAQAGHTVFLSSHLLHEVEQLCDRAAVLAKGRVIASGTVGELRGGDVLVLHTPDVEAAAGVVAALGGDSQPRAADLVVQLGDVAPDELVRRLVEAGVRVRALVPERAALEDVYLDLVGQQ